MLIQTVEKAASQSTQVPTVTEGVAAALLLSKLSVADSQAGKGLSLSRMVADDASFRVLGRSVLMFRISQDQLGHHHTGQPQGCLRVTLGMCAGMNLRVTPGDGNTASDSCHCPPLHFCSSALGQGLYIMSRLTWV